MLKSSTIKSLLISLAICAPWSARAQSTSNLVSDADLVTDADFDEANISGRVWTANIETCRDLLDDDEELEFEWTLNNAYSDSDLRYAIKLERPDGDCDTTSADQENAEECEFIAINQSVGSGTVYSVSVRPSRIFDMSTPDDCFTEQDGAHDMIMVLPLVVGGTDDSSHEPDVIRVRLDTKRPTPPPGAPEVQAGESRFAVNWTEATEADGYKIYVSSNPLNAGSLPESVVGANSVTTTSTSGTYSGGISAGEAYYVAVVSVDDAGNESVLSAITTVVAQPSEDFWEVYRSRGGAEAGGYCASASAGSTGSSLMLSLLLVIGLVRRRRKA